ncbi:hypothetical protein SAMN04515665_11243 [Blastococcus sp. DSM 46786]|uniref:DUF6338 family protein n=1 Tax=Blastococcus sp. DSM 46786 TaxID=1798227 RepID=UPI0008AD7D64|nr:DUF6338 family protein [Blastococcus sp. DSM 46786]SEL40667.1 hypothetical protein SAMN04515665_11243 [Blastococcus sp. DSM 46786]
MISTFQALVVALLFILPGAAYTFALERVGGSFGVKLVDRIFRFLAASAVFQALFSGPELWAYREWVASGRLERGEVPWWLVQAVALAYVLVPIGVGSLVGRGQKARWRWVTAFTGDSPEPRAWDYLWRRNARGLVRVRLKSGSWLAGIYGVSATGVRSYASGYDEEGDVYLAEALSVDPESGAYEVDDDSRPVRMEGAPGLLIRWSEVEYLEFEEIA